MTNAEAIQMLEKFQYHESWDQYIIDKAFEALNMAISALQAQDVPEINVGDMVSRQKAIDAIVNTVSEIGLHDNSEVARYGATFRQHEIIDIIGKLPSAQPEQRYTEEELRVFQHGISLNLLSKRSSQYWKYDEDTATEIEFLERLYEKVVADMRG